jgi:ABC-type amino acid transport substrate-binding protein
MLRKLFILILALLLLSCRTDGQVDLTEEEIAYAATTVIAVGTDANFAPYTTVSSTGEATGLSIDVLKKVAARTGLRLDFRHYQNREELLADFSERKIDVLATVNPTPNELMSMGLTEPYALLSTVMLLNDLPINFPLKVGYAPNYFGQDRLNNLKKQVTIVPLDTDHLAFRALMAGAVDGVVTNLGSAYYFEGQYHRHFKMAPIEFPYALSLGFQRSNWLLGSILQKGVHSLTLLERREMKLEYESPPDTPTR